MFCHNCGAQINDNAKFCDTCGTQTSAELANIQAGQEKNRRENPQAYLDLKTAIFITIGLFIVLPAACLFADIPLPVALTIGFGTAGVMGAICIVMGIRNKFLKK